MKKFLFLGLAGLLAAGFSSCSNDDLLADRDQVLDHDQSFFVNISINSADAMTRAYEGGVLDNSYPDGDGAYDATDDPYFETGEDYENKVQTVFLIFYDSNGDRVSTTQVRRDNFNSQAFNNSGHKIFEGVVQIDVKHGSTKPAYVMAFINPITSTNFDINPNFATLEALERTTRPRIIDDNNNFAMSKSVYYGKNRVTGKENDRIMATPLTEDEQLFTKIEDAEEALRNGEGVVDIYVERYAAKVKFSIKDDANLRVDLDDDGNNYLEFVPEYWAVNAYESDTYITKSFFESIDLETGAVGKILEYDDMVNAFGGEGNAWYWNSPEFHRCYWAQSPAYYAQAYPRVADDIHDNGAAKYALGYYSYNDMVKNATGKLIDKARSLQDGSDKARNIYARENTIAGSSLKSAYEDPFASPKAAVASVVLVGHYKLNGQEVKDEDFFYVMGNKVNGYTLFKNDDDMLDYFVRTTVPFAKDAQGTQFFDYNNIKFLDGEKDAYAKYFKIVHPGVDARGKTSESGSLIIDSRFVTIQLDETAITDDAQPLFAYLNGSYVQVTPANIGEINKQMLYTAGTVQGFQGGKAYFTIPIKHLGFYRKANPNAAYNANDKEFDWTKVQSGDFGLVRNHVYSIVVDNINGLGNAIPDPDDPIVPPTDPEEYFIGARIIVLNWAVVPTQNVTL
ncbi:MAG: fimbria major subunit [Muribaculaceae bacterium]|nr:fimbria major subunit [Muribaculaceae bacterium]